jgi:hypothetical protein
LRLGTFFPARRASDSPMAIACLRDFTFLPERPLRRVPAFRSCMALATFALLALLYLRAIDTSCKSALSKHTASISHSARGAGCRLSPDLLVGIARFRKAAQAGPFAAFTPQRVARAPGGYFR